MESERELINRVIGRDSQAFDVLMSRCHQQIRSHIARIVCDEAAAEDLSQEVALRLWERSEQWNGKGSVTSWLMRIATNLALDHLRWLRRKAERPLESPRSDAEEIDDDLVPGWMVDAATMAPDELASLDEQRSMVRDMIRSLPQETREMLAMVHEQEMTLAEVAQALGIPLGTVKSRLHYTFKMLGRQWPDSDRED